jgi:putative endonuclease
MEEDIILMIFTYILKFRRSVFYTGITNNLDRRLIEHNTGRSISTRMLIPATYIYHRAFDSRIKAHRHELYIKKTGAFRFLTKLRHSIHGKDKTIWTGF